MRKSVVKGLLFGLGPKCGPGISFTLINIRNLRPQATCPQFYPLINPCVNFPRKIWGKFQNTFFHKIMKIRVVAVFQIPIIYINMILWVC